jgi:hypothetical protein
MNLYPAVAKLRDEVVPVPGSNPPSGPVAGPGVPGEVFEGLGYNTTEKAPPPPPVPAPAPK